MSIELRPLGVACNLACHYCYQNPQRDAGNQRMTYDLEKMKKEAARIGGSFTLFGGEPLLMRFEDLEHLFAWGLETFGSNAIQTNGILIEDRHIDLFRRYKVSVGISLDGPGELNDARWHRGLEKTRQSTAIVENVIERLCREYQAPGLIITLHKGNATADKLPVMTEWLRKLHAIGIKSVRLHLLEVDHDSVRESLSLSARENVQALLAFADVQESLVGMHLDLFEEMEALLSGQDAKVGCTWRACDPYTTEAVQGVEGNGQSSNCGRTNKDGIGFIKADTAGYERYLALYRTPQAENGCAGCRFFLMCKGQCPGTSIAGDWRNRTEHCEEWKHLFTLLERRMILAGKIPLTIQPLRFELERRQLQAWENGKNPSLSRTLSQMYQKQSPESQSTPAEAPIARMKTRVSWVSQAAREKWQARLERLPAVLEEMTVNAADPNTERCAVRVVPASSFPRLLSLAAERGLAAAILPAEALPGGICTQPAEEATGLFLTGSTASVEASQAAWAKGNIAAFQSLLDLPACCLSNGAAAQKTTAPSFLAPLGLSILPITPCRFDCPAAITAGERWLRIAEAAGYESESASLREIFSWAMSWSELHGVIEVKTPLFKMCIDTGRNGAARVIQRPGISQVEGSVTGLNFPYSAPPRQSRMVQIAGVM